ncbi:MAG: hypothetical protein RLZZ373_2930 [Pseudomonadota bacterium]
MKFPLTFPLTAVAALVGALVLALPAQAGMDGARGARISGATYSPTHAGQSDASARSDGSQGAWRGRSHAEWAQSFWRWTLSIPFNANPAIVGGDCEVNQEGPVWFLVGPLGGSFSRTCTVPVGKAILAPVAVFLSDYPCPSPPAFEPAPGQTFADFLGGGLIPLIESYSVVEARLNGRSLKPRRITTRTFGFTAAADLKAVDGCLTGSPQVGLSDGFFVTIEPLPRGDHILQLRSVSGILGMTEGTFTLKVR